MPVLDSPKTTDAKMCAKPLWKNQSILDSHKASHDRKSPHKLLTFNLFFYEILSLLGCLLFVYRMSAIITCDIYFTTFFTVVYTVKQLVQGLLY